MWPEAEMNKMPSYFFPSPKARFETMTLPEKFVLHVTRNGVDAYTNMFSSVNHSIEYLPVKYRFFFHVYVYIHYHVSVYVHMLVSGECVVG